MQQDSVVEPSLPADVVASDLDAEARRDLRGLQKDTADTVAKHLVAAGRFIETDAGRALLHARFARRRASRIAVVREAAGIAAYRAGEWNEALGELRAARRMGGGPGHLAVMADIERALGRPERALELARGPEARELERADAIELTIVAAGARRDLGELDAAVIGLQIPELDEGRRDPWSARLFYAYADNLLAAGRESDALQWFVHAVDADVEGATDADRRVADLTGEPLPDDEVEFEVEELGVEAFVAVNGGLGADDDGADTDDSEAASVVVDTVTESDAPTEALPVVSTVVDEAAPAVDEAAPAGDEAAPAGDEAAPAGDEAAPAGDPAPPEQDPPTDALPIVAAAGRSVEAVPGDGPLSDGAVTHADDPSTHDGSATSAGTEQDPAFGEGSGR